MVDRFKFHKKTIFIADIAYKSYNLFAHTEKQEMYYLVRVRDGNRRGILSGLTLQKETCFDTYVTYTLTRNQTEKS